jgi:hypothetical protein
MNNFHNLDDEFYLDNYLDHQFGHSLNDICWEQRDW